MSEGTQLDMPRDGWQFIPFQDIDFFNPIYPCPRCKEREFRYLFTMKHKEHPPITVCHTCANEMVLNPTSWLAGKWRRSQAGNDFKNAWGFNVVIFQHKDGSGSWGARIAENRGPYRREGGDEGDVIWSDRYPTSDGAKRAAFDLIYVRAKEEIRTWRKRNRERRKEERLKWEQEGAEVAKAVKWMRGYLTNGLQPSQSH
jgi:hypothetical protein